MAGLYDDAGMCGSCDSFYCAAHRHVTGSGLGACPAGHAKSLDPFMISTIADDF